MTLEKLNQLRRNIIALKKLQEKIEKKRQTAEGISQNFSGMPSAKGSTDGRENIIETYSEVISYIRNISDPAIRLIFHYRFICGYSWVKTAMEIGGGNTDDSVRKRVEKYLQKN